MEFAVVFLIIVLFYRRKEPFHPMEAYEEPVHVVVDEQGTHVELVAP